jgi:hypothetical protein
VYFLLQTTHTHSYEGMRVSVGNEMKRKTFDRLLKNALKERREGEQFMQSESQVKSTALHRLAAGGEGRVEKLKICFATPKIVCSDRHSILSSLLRPSREIDRQKLFAPTLSIDHIFLWLQSGESG